MLILSSHTCSPTFIDIVKKRSVGDYSGIPYVCTLLNCLLWVVYGLPVVEFQVLVVSINAAGCVIEITYLVLYLINAQRKIKVRFTRILPHTFSSYNIIDGSELFLCQLDSQI